MSSKGKANRISRRNRKLQLSRPRHEPPKKWSCPYPADLVHTPVNGAMASVLRKPPEVQNALHRARKG